MPAWKHARLLSAGGNAYEEDMENHNDGLSEWVDVIIVDPDASDSELVEIHVREPRGRLQLVSVSSGSSGPRRICVAQDAGFGNATRGRSQFGLVIALVADVNR